MANLYQIKSILYGIDKKDSLIMFLSHSYSVRKCVGKVHYSISSGMHLTPLVCTRCNGRGGDVKIYGGRKRSNIEELEYRMNQLVTVQLA